MGALSPTTQPWFPVRPRCNPSIPAGAPSPLLVPPTPAGPPALTLPCPHPIPHTHPYLIGFLGIRRKVT